MKDLIPEDAPPLTPSETAFVKIFDRSQIAPYVAAISIALCLPSLFIGFYLDDFVALYIYSDLPGAARLYDAYAGGYGIANGDPVDTHWQIEQGWAPWWTYPELDISLFRPLSLATHLFDMKVWPESAFMMHAHNLFWLGLLTLAMTRLYRGALGWLVGGLAAVLFAFDPTHGFEVGYICNRHALVTAVPGVLALDLYLRSRSGDERARWLAPLAYILALLGGESAIAIGAYIFAHALVGDAKPARERAVAFAPYLIITITYRVLYSLAGYGAHGSGLYIDPAREPLHFLASWVERAPLLINGFFFGPPAEFYVFTGPTLSTALLVLAVVLTMLMTIALIPLLRRDRMARFWALGMLGSLIPAASVYPHNRQLLFASIGGLALIAQLRHLYVFRLRGSEWTALQKFSEKICEATLVGHLVIAPLALPISTWSIAFTAQLQDAPDSVGDELAGRDAVFVTAPEYFAVRLVQLSRRIHQQPLPRRWRALSFGPQAVTMNRMDDTTLELDYEGGILGAHVMELYRDDRIPMQVGETIELEGLTIEVLEVTTDGRARKARFAFDTSLDSQSFVFYRWSGDKFERFEMPAVGEYMEFAPATIELGLW